MWQRFVLFCGILVSLAFSTADAADLSATVSVNSLQLVSSSRISRTVFEYVYRLNLVNAGGGVQNVVIAGGGSGAGFSFVDNSASGGSIAAGASVLTSDTITIRQDRIFPLPAITWTITGDVVNGGGGPTGLTCFNPALTTPGTVIVYNRRHLFNGATDYDDRLDITISGPTMFQGNVTNVTNLTLTVTSGPGTGISSSGNQTFTSVIGTNEVTFGAISPLIPGPGINTTVFSPPQSAPIDLAVNQSDTQTYTATDTISGAPSGNGSTVSSFTRTNTFLGLENVTVPAGTFLNACKWQIETTVDGNTATVTRWSPQGVGFQVRDLDSGGGDDVMLPGSSINGVPIAP